MDNVQCLRTSGARGLEQAIEALSYFLRAKPWSPFLVCQGVTHREPGRDLHASVAPYGKESRGLHLHAEDPFRLALRKNPKASVWVPYRAPMRESSPGQVLRDVLTRAPLPVCGVPV